MIKDSFKQLANGSKIRLAYAKHEVHLYKEHQKELYGILICVSEPENRSRRYKGFALVGDFNARGYVLSMSESEGNLSIFCALAEYVLERLALLDNVHFDTFRKIIDEWRSFAQGDNDAIKEKAQIGIFGELLFFHELLQRSGGNFALISWTGPEKSKVDFTISTDKAVEVKTSKDPLKNEVTISSIDQLSSGFDFHYLRRYGLIETINGMTICDLYKLINSYLSEYELKFAFRMKLLSSGFNPSKEYDNLLRLEMATKIDYDVQKDDFPKIVPPLNEKIVKLSYTIRLDGQQPMFPTELFDNLYG